MTVDLDSSFPKPTAWDSVRMMMFNNMWMQNRQKRILVTRNWESSPLLLGHTGWIANFSLTCQVGQKNSPTPPPYLLGVSFPAPRLNKSLTAVHRSRSYQNTGCNIALSHRWNEKQIARWTGGTFVEQEGGVWESEMISSVCEYVKFRYGVLVRWLG